MYTTHFTANRDIQTAFHDIGRGTPLLLVHGFTGSKLDFTNQVAWFVESHRVIAFDQRGHGETSNLGPYTLDQLCADLLNLLDALDVPTCHILGHSMGGMVVLRAVLKAPERFRSLMLMDTAPHGLRLFSSQAKAQISARVRDHGCASLMEGMRGQAADAATQRGIDFLGEQEYWRRIRVKLEQMDTEAFTDLVEELENQPDLTPRLGEIGIPTTIIVGAEDKPFVKPAQTFQQHITGSELVTVPRAGHSPQYENSDVWRDAVLKHLARS